MSNINMNIFLKDIAYFEKLFSDISTDFPDLKPLMDDLLYPMGFIHSLANEAQGVLHNDPNSIEQMRFLLNPATVEGEEIYEAVFNLLPDNHEYDKIPNLTDSDSSFIHFGHLLVTTIAAGRAGMKTFNLCDSTNEFIDIVKFYALAALPLQVLANVLRSGRSIENFIQSYLHQSRHNDNYLFLKTLIKTFWDSRALSSAKAINTIAEQVKLFFANYKALHGWDGLTSTNRELISIINVRLKTTDDNPKNPIHITTNYNGDKDKLLAFYLWDSVNDGDNLGIVTRQKILGKSEYQKSKNIFMIDEFDEDLGIPSGWVALRTEAEIAELKKFAIQFKRYWIEQTKEFSNIFNTWPIPIDIMPLENKDFTLLPVIRRDNSNKWGPEILDITLAYQTTDTNKDDKTLSAELTILHSSQLPPAFKVFSYQSSSAHILNSVKTTIIDHRKALVTFDLNELAETDHYVFLELYTAQRESAYDTELVELDGADDFIANNTEEIPQEDNPPEGNTPTTPPGTSPANGNTTTRPVNNDSTTEHSTPLDLVIVRPGILQLIDIDDQQPSHIAHVYQISKSTLEKSIIALENHTSITFTVKEIPFLLDEEVTLKLTNQNIQTVHQDTLLQQLKTLSETTQGLESALWVSLIESEISFYKIGYSTGAAGLIVSTVDQLTQAWDAIKRQSNPLTQNKIENTISFPATVFNGALSIDRFLQHRKRILDKRALPIPSQWVALGYTKNRQITFEQRINLPDELYSGPLQLNLPSHPDLDKIELRYQPQLYAIEIASITQPRIAEASVRLMSNSTVYRGSTFRQVTPAPTKRLLTLQRPAGDVNIEGSYNRNTNSITWIQHHTSALKTRVSIGIHSLDGDINRTLASFNPSVSQYDLNQFLIHDTQANHLRGFSVTTSDGWNSKTHLLTQETSDFNIQQRTLLPRKADNNIYWADPDYKTSSTNAYTKVIWKINGKSVFDTTSININRAVQLPQGTEKHQISIEVDSEYNNANELK